LKSSDEWVTRAATGTTAEASSGSNIQSRTEYETFLPDTRVNETEEITKGHSNPS